MPSEVIHKIARTVLLHTANTYSQRVNDLVDRLGFQRFLTVPEAAELLRVDVADVHTLIRSGELAALRVGNRGPWRIEADVLEEFIAQQYELARREAAFHSGAFANISVLPADF